MPYWFLFYILVKISSPAGAQVPFYCTNLLFLYL